MQSRFKHKLLSLNMMAVSEVSPNALAKWGTIFKTNKKIFNYNLIKKHNYKLASSLVMFLLVTSLPFSVFASTAGPQNPSGHANVIRAGSTINWQNTVNVLSSDNAYATANLGGTNSHYLVAKNFGFAIPSDAVIKGIQVTVEKKSTSGLISDLEVRLVKDGTTPVGQNKALVGGWPLVDTDFSYGGTSDLWLTTFTPAEINNANFGVALAAKSSSIGSIRTASVDNIRVSVTFNAPPVANDDGYVMNEDEVLNISAPGILINDSDIDGDSLTVIPVSGTSNGVLAINPDGSFTYTPDLNFNGVDSFTYKAFDGELESNIATVTITINAVNDPPVAMNDFYSTPFETTLNVPIPGILINDGDVDGDPITAIQLTSPSDGILFLNSDGSFSYAPDSGFTGVDSFLYKANDGTLDSNDATVTITVGAKPVDPPVGGNLLGIDTLALVIFGINANLVFVAPFALGAGFFIYKSLSKRKIS